MKIWQKNKKLLSGNKKNKFQSPFLFKNYFLFFAKNGEQIEFVELSKKFKIKKELYVSKDLPFEKFSIYAPFVLKYKILYHVLFCLELKI